MEILASESGFINIGTKTGDVGKFLSAEILAYNKSALCRGASLAFSFVSFYCKCY